MERWTYLVLLVQSMDSVAATPEVLASYWFRRSL